MLLGYSDPEKLYEILKTCSFQGNRTDISARTKSLLVSTCSGNTPTKFLDHDVAGIILHAAVSIQPLSARHTFHDVRKADIRSSRSHNEQSDGCGGRYKQGYAIFERRFV